MSHAIGTYNFTFYLMHTVVIVNAILMLVILRLSIVMTYETQVPAKVSTVMLYTFYTYCVCVTTYQVPLDKSGF